MEDPVQSLVEFLASSPPDTGLRVLNWRSIGNNEIACEIEADSPWWVASPERSALLGTLDVALHGVVASRVDLSAKSIDAEDLTASRDEPLLWSFAPKGTLFGNAPVDDSLAFVVELADWLIAQRAPLEFGEYFGFGTLGEVAARLTHRSYKLLSGPMPLLNAAKQMLEARRIPHLLKPAALARTPPLTAVWAGDSWVVCEDATVSLSTRIG